MNEELAMKILKERLTVFDLNFDNGMKKGMRMYGADFFTKEIIAIVDKWYQNRKLTLKEVIELVNRVEFLKKEYLEEVKNNQKFVNYQMDKVPDSIIDYLERAREKIHIMQKLMKENPSEYPILEDKVIMKYCRMDNDLLLMIEQLKAMNYK